MRSRNWVIDWLRSRVVSGTNGAEAADPSPQEELLIRILDRQTAFQPLEALVNALSQATSVIPIGQTAIGLDANVFLRLSGHRRGADIIDYLSSAHRAPLILPGQAVQEFWNNQLQAVDAIAAGLRKKFSDLRDDLQKIDPSFGDYASQFVELLDKFSAEYGHLYDEGTVRKTLSFLEMLRSRALLPYAPRTRFHDIAAHRKRTKTPPGFRDDGDGDFFIWVDFLTGLQASKAEQRAFAKAVLVSHDRKLDWSRSGIAHPILVAEVNALVDVPFEIWNIDKLAEEITKLA
jgi:hypothetical protein